jgi:hypothetical protein
MKVILLEEKQADVDVTIIVNGTKTGLLNII